MAFTRHDGGRYTSQRRSGLWTLRTLGSEDGARFQNWSQDQRVVGKYRKDEGVQGGFPGFALGY